ncbi:hypothetical protein BH20CHL7_BH20CHL7_01420 [soil metagenome]
MRSILDRLVRMQDGWAKPLGDALHVPLAAIGRPLHPLKDLLNGTWLGHPLHPAITDVPIGAFAVAIVLDLVGERDGALWGVIVGQVAFLGALLTGLADYTDTDGRARTRATIHGTIMVIGGGLTAASLVVRSNGGDPGLATGLLILGFLVVLGGAYVGGDVVFVFGNMVSRHAFRGPGSKWVRLDTGEVADLDALPEATPTKMRAGINDLVVVRVGATIRALHAVCAHAGGPLEQGAVTADGCLECPWHRSRFRLADGAMRQGPSVYDQPAYEIRVVDGVGYEVRRAAP